MIAPQERTPKLAESFDRSVDEIVWSPDSKQIYFTAVNEAEQPVYEIAAASGSTPREIVKDSFNESISIAADGNTFAFLRSSLTAPAEVFTARSDGTAARELSQHNAARLASIDMNPPESFWYEGAGGTRIQGMLIRPPHFDASKKYPLLLLIHGGPQSLWTDSWGYRWNEELFAAPGYVAVLINPRGSTGYGQKFTDEITDDWGGRVYEDLMKGVDYVIGNYPYVDASRVAAAGGSYGGYMIDWIATHTGRFKVLISHAGVYDKTCHVRRYRGAVVRGARHGGNSLDASRELSKMVSEHVRRRSRQIQDSDAGDLRRTRLPRAVHAKPRILHCPATAKCALRNRGVPRRGTLDPETTE